MSGNPLSGGLQVSVIGGAHHGAAGHIGKTQRLGDLCQFIEGFRFDITFHGQMVLAWLQILPKGQHVAAVGAQVTHDFDDLFIRFSQSQHQPRFSRKMGELRLELL